MNTSIRFSLLVLMLATLACSTLSMGLNQVVGSGHVTAETRDVATFTSVELAGSADVNILLGNVQSVNVEGDDNIVPLIQTTVTNGRLVIGTRPGVTYTSPNRVTVTLVMKSLSGVTLSGSGNIHVGDTSGADLAVNLTGSGDITVQGVADHVSIGLSGSGNIQCNELKAKSVDATVTGSGNITAYASAKLNAQISGSGTIRYDGSPAQVTKNITGSGTITP